MARMAHDLANSCWYFWRIYTIGWSLTTQLRVQMFKQGDTSSRQKMGDSFFQRILWQTQESTSSYRFYFKVDRTTYVLLKTGTTDFKNSPPFQTGMFLCDNHLNVFNSLTLKQVFCKTKTFRFSVQSIKNESVLFPYNAALSKANVKTNWMGSIEYTCQKELVFATDYFFF